MHLTSSGAAIDANKDYVVAGWASVNEGTEGPPIWDVVGAHLKGKTLATMQAGRTVKFTRAGN
jgi:sulfur-oxidizing protein SoxB